MNNPNTKTVGKFWSNAIQTYSMNAAPQLPPGRSLCRSGPNPFREATAPRGVGFASFRPRNLRCRGSGLPVLRPRSQLSDVSSATAIFLDPPICGVQFPPRTVRRLLTERISPKPPSTTWFERCKGEFANFSGCAGAACPHGAVGDAVSNGSAQSKTGRILGTACPLPPIRHLRRSRSAFELKAIEN